MKAIISNRIYLVIEPSQLRHFEKELTYSIPSFNDPDQFISIKNLKIINYNIQGGKMLVSFPVGRFDLIPNNYEIVDKRITNTIDNFPVFNGQLRDSQQEVLDLFEGNCIVNAKPGWGKTFWAIALSSKLKQKTLIVTHTVDLRTQWEREIVKTLGIKPGVIGSGKFNTNSPIVVSNVQTLTKKVNQVSREFGLTILDEMHHVSSPTFGKVIDAMFSKYKVGLSGTIERKDQKHVVFKDYFSSTVFQPKRENVMKPTVHIYDPGIIFSDSGNAHWSEKINVLMESSIYRNLLIKLADKYSRDGYIPVTVTDRVECLKYCHSNSETASGLIIGEVKDRDSVIEKIFKKEIFQLWGTQNMLSEGISIEPLSALILGTPLNNIPLLEQLIGRIERKYPDKLPPIIVDIKLTGNIAHRQFMNRLGYYMKAGYDIKYM